MTNQKGSAMSSLKLLTGSRVPWTKVDLYVLLSYGKSIQLLIDLPESRWSNDPDKRSGAP